MRRRPALTLLLITRRRIARADFRRGSPPSLAGLWQQPSPDTEDISLLAEVALALGPRPARRVWVLNEELWTQTLSLEATAVAALPADELDRALAFEVEPLSGLSAFDSALGHRLLDKEKGQLRYWVSQAPADELRRVEEVVRQAGGTLAGMCHPGGLPRPLAADGRLAWERVELWPDAVVCVHGQPRAAPRLLVVNASPQQAGWREEHRLWQTTAGTAAEREALLSGSDLATLADSDRPPLLLDDEASLTAWLTAWAEQLSTRAAEVPVLRPAPQPLSQNAQGGIALVLMLLVVAGCVAHHLHIKRLLTPLNAELQSLQNQRNRLSALQKQKADLEKNQKELAKEVETLAGKTAVCQRALDAHRGRMAALLDVLARRCPKDLFIRRIEGGADLARLHGLCTESRGANRFAALLDSELRPLNWRAALRGQSLSPESELYAFEIEIRDVTLPPPAAPKNGGVEPRRSQAPTVADLGRRPTP